MLTGGVDETPRVLARHADIVALEKPAGWLVHPVGTEALDLVGWARAQGLGRLRPAHRLDLDTSGVVLFGKTVEATARLGGWFTEGAVAKRYLALVYDVPPASGVIDVPLADSRRARPLAAVTEFSVECALGRFALLALTPRTGRKHQLRRHLSGIGHPIVGDREYPVKPFRKVPGFPGRLWLHAASLRLPDGFVVESPLPAVLAAHVDLLSAQRRPPDAPLDARA